MPRQSAATDRPSPNSGGADRLPLPDAIAPARVNWPYAVTIVAMHGLALLALVPALASWTGAIIALLGVFVFGQSINLCYHRLLAHRSARVPRWLERGMVVMALCCLQDTPARWVATHRYHHNHSDEHEDPHSPLVAFLWAHVGWLLVRNPATQNIGVYRKFAPDVLADPFYLKLEKRPWLQAAIFLGQVAVFFVVGLAFGGPWLGLSLVVWGVVVRTVVVWHITWSVNSLTHLFGYTSYETDDHSRNNWLVALLAVGEGWHNNHHHDPASASNQHRWWEFDPTYYMIKLLELVGLARDVVQPRHRRHAARIGSAGGAGSAAAAATPRSPSAD